MLGIFAKQFNLEEKRAMEIYASVIMNIYRDGMCKTCGIHPLHEKAIELMVNVKTNTPDETNYKYFILGFALQTESLWFGIASSMGEPNPQKPIEEYIAWAIADMKSQFDDLRASLN